MAWAVRLRVRSVTRTWPPVASPPTRDPTFTTSPVMFHPDGSVTAGATSTSPVLRPAWTSGTRMPERPALSERIDSTAASPARTARSASSSCAVGTPKTARKPSPMTWGTVPPKLSTSSTSPVIAGRMKR